MLKRTILRGLLHKKASLSSLLSAELNILLLRHPSRGSRLSIEAERKRKKIGKF